MQKTAKIALCVLTALILAMSLCACGGAAGHYALTSIEIDGTTIDVAQMREVLGDGEMYLELNRDGTAFLNMEILGDSEILEMEWADGYIWAAGDESSKVPFMLDGKVLTMEQDGQKLVFTKD